MRRFPDMCNDPEYHRINEYKGGKKEGGSLVTLPSSPSVFLYFVPLPTT